jgi:hypothetical protein
LPKPSKYTWINWTKDALVIGLVSLFLIALLEGGVRLFFPLNPQPKSPAYRFNPDYNVALKPNLTRSFRRVPENGGQRIKWETNQDAFRGLALQRSPDFRIMVYGDSNIQAKFSHLEDTFPVKLQSDLAALTGSRNLEVINAGVVGFGPDQALIRFSQEADIYKPNIVIFHIFADNDFGDLIRNRLFELDEQGRLVQTRFPIKEDGRLAPAEGGLLASSGLFRIAKMISSKLRTQKTAETIADEQCEAELAIYHDRKPRGLSHFGDHYDLDLALDPESEASQVKVRLMAAVLKKASEVAASKGITFVVVIQPSQIDLTRNGSLSYADLARYPNYRPSNLSGRLEDICRRNDLACINLFPTFQKNNSASLFFKGSNNHWNDEGQALAAKVTAIFLADKIFKSGGGLAYPQPAAQ